MIARARMSWRTIAQKNSIKKASDRAIFKGDVLMVERINAIGESLCSRSLPIEFETVQVESDVIGIDRNGVAIGNCSSQIPS